MAEQRYNPLDDISAFMKRFVIFTDESHAEVLALWILHTWTFDAAYATPYIYVNSAEPQSGKTRTMEVCELLARGAISASMLTAASLFSMIGSTAPALFIDEVDTIFTGKTNEELRGVLNSGYKQGGKVPRYVGKTNEEGDREVTFFPTFCPKMLVGIDNAAMPDTLKDRCIPLTLKRKKSDQEVERFIPRKVEPEAAELTSRIELWANQNLERVMDAAEPKVIEGISDRSFEIAEPLLVLARVAGGAAQEKKARAALKSLLETKKPALSLGIQTLTAVKELMDESGTDRISSAALAAHMGISPKKLGTVLAPYGITPDTVRFASGEKLKGYVRVKFEDAWERYL